MALTSSDKPTGFFKNFLENERNRISRKLEQLPTGNEIIQCFSGSSQNVSNGFQVEVEDLYKLLEVILRNNLDYSNATGQSVLDLWPKTRAHKDEDLSVRNRETGNSCLQRDQLPEAIQHYNEAVLLAPVDSRSFALALANRGMAWIKCQEYHLAMSDLKNALGCQLYPEESRFKLFQRLAKCSSGLSDYAGEISFRKKMIDSLELSSLTTEQKLKLIHEASKTIETCKKKLTMASFLKIEVENNLSEEEFPVYKNTHPLISNASDCVEVTFSDSKGRHVVASRDIDVGECIVNDFAATKVIHLKNSLSHCYTCLRHVISPYPCKDCSAVVFCSPECQEVVAESHSYGCQLSLYDMYLQYGSKGAGYTALIFLAFELISKVPAKTLLEYAETSFSKPKSDSLPIGEKELKHCDVIFNMAVHWKNGNDLFEKIAAGLFLMNCLETTGYFSDSKLTSSQECYQSVRLFFTKLLVHFVSSAHCNNHSFSEIAKVPLGVERQIVGLAIFPTTASLINHSCDPNTSTVVAKNRQVTVATRFIKKGEEICHIYQGHFGDTPFEKRQKLLQEMYGFKCSCNACIEDFPLAGDLPKTYEDILGSNDQAQSLDIEHSRIGSEILDAIENDDLARVQELYAQRTRLASRHLGPRPHLIYLSTRSGIVDTLGLRFGNRNYAARNATFKGAYM